MAACEGSCREKGDSAAAAAAAAAGTDECDDVKLTSEEP